MTIVAKILRKKNESEELAMNKVIEIGRLTKDPEIRYSQGANATCVARYTLAVDRKFKQEGQPTADFINCIAFGKLGEFAEKYLHKGVKIAVTGRIQTGSYKNKDGNTVYTTDVVVEEQEFCESKSQSSSQPHPVPSNNDGFMSIPDGLEDEGLPFN